MFRLKLIFSFIIILIKKVSLNPLLSDIKKILQYILVLENLSLTNILSY